MCASVHTLECNLPPEVTRPSSGSVYRTYLFELIRFLDLFFVACACTQSQGNRKLHRVFASSRTNDMAGCLCAKQKSEAFYSSLVTFTFWSPVWGVANDHWQERGAIKRLPSCNPRSRGGVARGPVHDFCSSANWTHTRSKRSERPWSIPRLVFSSEWMRSWMSFKSLHSMQHCWVQDPTVNAVFVGVRIQACVLDFCRLPGMSNNVLLFFFQCYAGDELLSKARKILLNCKVSRFRLSRPFHQCTATAGKPGDKRRSENFKPSTLRLTISPIRQTSCRVSQCTTNRYIWNCLGRVGREMVSKLPCWEAGRASALIGTRLQHIISHLLTLSSSA